MTEPWPQPQCPSPQFPWSLLPDAHPGHTKAVGDHSIGSLVFCYIVVLQGRVGETCQERFQVLWYVTYLCWSFEWNCISKQPHFSTHVFLTTCLCLQNVGQLGLHFDLQPLHGLETRNTSQHVRPSGSTRLKGWRVASSLLSGSLQFEASLLVHFQLVLSDLSYFSHTFFYHIYQTYLTSIFTSISLWRSVSLHICRHMYISLYLYLNIFIYLYMYLFMNHIWRSIISPCIWSMYQIHEVCRDQATRTKKGQPKGVGSFQVILAGVTHSWNVPKTHQKSSWNDDMKWYEMISAISHHHNIENDHLRIMKWFVNDIKSKKTQRKPRPCYQGQGPRLWWRRSLANWSFAWPPQNIEHRNIESNVLWSVVFLQSIRKKIQPESNLELVATGLIVIWQYLLRGPPTCDKEWSDSPIVPMPMGPMGPMCLSPNKRQPSHDPTVLIQSLIWNAAMALVNVVELHRPLHVAKCYKMCYIDDIDMMAIMVFQTKGQVSQVFSRKRGSNHGEVRGTANQLDDMLEPRLIAAQALHIQGNNKYAVKWPV